MKMSRRSKIIMQLAAKNYNNEIEPECSNTITSSPTPTLPPVFPDILELDDRYLVNNYSQLTEECYNKLKPDSPLPKSEDISKETVIESKCTNSMTSSPVPSLPPELEDMLLSEDDDDSVVDKDYMPEKSESYSNSDSSDDDTNSLLIRRNHILSSKKYISNSIARTSNQIISADIDKAGSSRLIQDQTLATRISLDTAINAGPSGSTQDHGVEEKDSKKPIKKWSRVVRKNRTEKMHSGQSYVNVNEKLVNARQVKPLKQCRKKCYLLLSDDIRKTLFSEYWSLGSRDKRVTFIANLINFKEVQVSRKRKRDSLKNRNATYEYFLEINGQRVSVCNDCFCRTLDEKEKFIKNVLKNKLQSTSGITLEDQRNKTPANKKTEKELSEVQAHIKSFPSHMSHYTRRVNDKKYLPSHLNLRIMYGLYKDGRENAVGRSIYEREFHKLKLSFKKPYVDTCYKCDTLNMQVKVANNEEKFNAERDLQSHQELANAAYDAKKKDKEEAKINPKKKCFSFDLQQCLPTPFIVSSVAFYKRQLWTYNLTIHDNATGESTNYMWHEALASRGGNEIASCLYRHLKTLPDSISEVTFYSNTCGGQNKNSHVAAMFIKAQSENPNLIINHKFLVPGHTHMECDIDHSMIEKQKKKMEIPVYHPHDWYQLVRKTGRKKQFKVHEMQQEEFFDFAALLKSGLVCRKKDTLGDTFSWHSVQWLQYKENGLVHYKMSLNNSEDFKVLSFLRRGRNRVLKDFSVHSKYNGFIPISTEKKRDLCSLLCLIPSVFHEFYKNLPTSANVIDNDPDLVEEEVDGEN